MCDCVIECVLHRSETHLSLRPSRHECKKMEIRKVIVIRLPVIIRKATTRMIVMMIMMMTMIITGWREGMWGEGCHAYFPCKRICSHVTAAKTKRKNIESTHTRHGIAKDKSKKACLGFIVGCTVLSLKKTRWLPPPARDSLALFQGHSLTKIAQEFPLNSHGIAPSRYPQTPC